VRDQRHLRTVPWSGSGRFSARRATAAHRRGVTPTALDQGGGSSVVKYTIRRITLNVLILFLVSVSTFFLMQLAPGDPAQLARGVEATPETIERIHRELGLDKPIPIQYVNWIIGTLTLDLPRSPLSQTYVAVEFAARFPVSLQLMVMTAAWTVLLGVPFGILSAVRQYSLSDYFVRFTAIFALSVPQFVVATMVLLVPVAMWGYTPPIRGYVSPMEDLWDNFRQFGPASLVLALSAIGSMMRLTRTSMLEVMRTDYVAKGLRERNVLVRHAFRNALIPVITTLGFLITNLLGGAIIIEQIFNLPGLGQYTFVSIVAKDYIPAQTLVMYAATVAVFMILIVDLSYAYIDPRIRYE
jgi:peptide/nickel transport system permease protein